MITEYLIIKTLYLVAVGIVFFVYEGIVIFDLFKGWGYWWTKEFFESTKDRNGDGKVSFLESTFPNDGGHFFKRLLVALTGSGIIFHEELAVWQFFLYSFFAWWIISAVFQVLLSRFRKLAKS